MSQPPLTVAIQKLEETIGTRLLDRNRHTVRLTPAGEVFWWRPGAPSRRPRSPSNPRAGPPAACSARCACPSCRARRWTCCPGAAHLPAQYPAVKLILSGETSGRQLELLRRGDTDPALVVPPVYEARDLSPDILCEGGTGAGGAGRAPARTPQAGAAGGTARGSLRRLPVRRRARLFGRDPAACQRAGFFPRVVQEAAQMQSIVTLVAGHLGVAIVPRAMTRVQARGVVYVEVAQARTTLRYPLVLASLAATDNAPSVPSWRWRAAPWRGCAARTAGAAARPARRPDASRARPHAPAAACASVRRPPAGDPAPQNKLERSAAAPRSRPPRADRPPPAPMPAARRPAGCAQLGRHRGRVRALHPPALAPCLQQQRLRGVGPVVAGRISGAPAGRRAAMPASSAALSASPGRWCSTPIKVAASKRSRGRGPPHSRARCARARTARPAPPAPRSAPASRATDRQR